MSTIQTAKSIQAFVPAALRPGCKSCIHRRLPERGETYPLYCGRGGFGTSPMGICGKYSAEALAPRGR